MHVRRQPLQLSATQINASKATRTRTASVLKDPQYISHTVDTHTHGDCLKLMLAKTRLNACPSKDKAECTPQQKTCNTSADNKLLMNGTRHGTLQWEVAWTDRVGRKLKVDHQYRGQALLRG